MARKKAISDEVREQVVAIVEKYNEDYVPPVEPKRPGLVSSFFTRLGGNQAAKSEEYLRYGAYRARFRGSFLYLDRGDFRGQPSAMCRLKWMGDMESWEFAIYKYSITKKLYCFISHGCICKYGFIKLVYNRISKI